MNGEQNEMTLSEVLKLIYALRQLGLTQEQIDNVLETVNSK